MDTWPRAEVLGKRCLSAGRSHMSIKPNSVIWPKPLDLAWPGARDLPSVLPFFLFELVICCLQPSEECGLYCDMHG